MKERKRQALPVVEGGGVDRRQPGDRIVVQEPVVLDHHPEGAHVVDDLGCPITIEGPHERSAFDPSALDEDSSHPTCVRLACDLCDGVGGHERADEFVGARLVEGDASARVPRLAHIYGAVSRR
jgi:hypothetical protein